MSLEERVAWWMNVGTIPYDEAHNLLLHLTEQRKAEAIPDVIVAAQHPITVSFGSSKEDNQFSDQLLDKVRGVYPDASLENVRSYLATKGVQFSDTPRGGGATVFAPGQYVFYPLVDHRKITSKKLDINAFKEKVYRVLFESLQDLGVKGIQLGSQSSFETRRERRDVWTQRNGVSLKMGSKAIHITGHIARSGFALYVDEKGVEPFWMVNPCGHDASEVQVTSVEAELKRRIPAHEVYTSVRGALQRQLGYTRLIERTLEEAGV